MISSVLVWVVMLRLLTICQSCSEESLKNDNQTCCNECPPGYHKSDVCSTLGIKARYRCKRCEDGSTFTSLKNHRAECVECAQCEETTQKVSKKCVYNSNAVCVCRDGYHAQENHDTILYCVLSALSCFNTGQKLPSNDCQRKECILHTEYQDHCNSSSKTSATPTTASGGGGPSEGTLDRSTPPRRTTDHVHNNIMTLVVILVVVVVSVVAVVFLVSSWFRIMVRIIYPIRRSVASDDPESTSLGQKLTAQKTLPPSTMTLNVCEDPPTMLLSQDPFAPAHPSHHHPLLRPMEAPAPPPPPSSPTGQRWPASVLYAVIQEVPLRRWKEFLRHLGVAEEQMERVEMEAGTACLGSREKQYQMLRLWTQQPTTTLTEVYMVLHRMELAGCAQLLLERLGTMGLGGAE